MRFGFVMYKYCGLTAFLLKVLRENVIYDCSFFQGIPYSSSQQKEKKPKKTKNLFKHIQDPCLNQILSASNFCEKYISGNYKY